MFPKALNRICLGLRLGSADNLRVLFMDKFCIVSCIAAHPCTRILIVCV